MNRIREIREALGLSSDRLAEMTGTSDTQIRRLETNERKLTTDWMQRIAAALQCAPGDLLAHGVIIDDRDEVETAEMPIPSLAGALAKKGLTLYKVMADSLSEIGIMPSDMITVDASASAINSISDGDPVLCRIVATNTLVLRQFLRPALVVTNRPGLNIAVRLDDRSMQMEITGVVIRV